VTQQTANRRLTGGANQPEELVATDLCGAPLHRPLSPFEAYNLSNRATITWRPTQEAPLPPGLRSSYSPFCLYAIFGGRPDLRCGYRLDKLRRHYGPFRDAQRHETWYKKSRPRKIQKLLSTGDQDSPFHVAPRRLDWKLKYISEFAFLTDRAGMNALQMKKLVLVEVSLPLYQIVCAWIDALRHAEVYQRNAQRELETTVLL